MMESQTIEQLLNFSKSKLCNTATKQQYKEHNGKMVQWFNAKKVHRYKGYKSTTEVKKRTLSKR